MLITVHWSLFSDSCSPPIGGQADCCGLLLQQSLHACPVRRNAVDHVVGTTFEVDSGGQVPWIFLQHLIEMNAGLREFLSIVALKPALKGGFGLFLESRNRFRTYLEQFI